MFTPLGKILQKKVQNSPFGREILVLKAKTQWQKTVASQLGSDILKEVKLETCKNGCLVVRVSSPVVAQELKLREKTILDKTNQALSHSVLRKILYRLG